jgi:hypothetical protein
MRNAYLRALKDGLASTEKVNILTLKQQAVAAMQAVVATKLALFGSVGKA